MPLKSTAAGVNQAFHEPTMKRVEQKVVDKLEQLEMVSTFVSAALDAAVTAYFTDREAQGLPPYVLESHNSYRAKIEVLSSATFASGNNPDLETALKTLDERLAKEVSDRVRKECSDAGYTSCWVRFEPAQALMTIELGDARYQPIESEWVVQRKVREALGDV